MTEIKATIKEDLLRKLYGKRIIGARHTSIHNLPKGFPKHLHKDVIDVAHELIKDGLLIRKPTSYGIEVSLNPRKILEIKSIIHS